MRCQSIPHLLLFAAFFLALSASGESAANLLSQTGVKGGLIVHVGSTDAQLTTSLRANASYQVQALTRDPATLATLRKGIGAAYGPVAADLLTTPHLPYIENLVNLLVVEDPQISRQEIDRVLVPDGVALIKTGDSWEKIVKPRPHEMDPLCI
jgi:phosphohistidine phosphatase SixA